jgi:hypothetical protein
LVLQAHHLQPSLCGCRSRYGMRSWSRAIGMMW